MLIGLISVSGSGCSTVKPYELPDFTLAERDETKTPVDPDLLPELCDFPQDNVWPTKCWGTLEQYVEIADTNTGIGQTMSDALEKSQASYDQILAGATYQQDLAQMREGFYQQCLAEKTQDKWMYRGIIGGIIVLAVAGAAQ